MAGKGTELAVGYISLVAETGGLAKDIDRAFSQAGRNVESHGQKMGKSMARGADKGFAFRPRQHMEQGVKDAEGIGSRMGKKMSGALSSTLAQGLATAGIAGGLAGVAASFTTAIKAGVDYETNLNKIQGVTAATAEQMGAVNAKARELGADVTLTGVSAQTAAAGMLELAKGGLTVEQAMEASRGTMALATAAGIEAGKAATIQADAINAFGLSAKDASKVADVLANVANVSTGELTDFAYGLQMSSAVANQFGMSVDETAASLGLLANAGVKGSDAGTLIKSMLLALASPSKDQAASMHALGLEIWDASGKFVGMADVLEQLHQQSKKMTPEWYAFHSSTAFGSDAARIAGVAARVGAQGFNEMRDAVNQVGGAARVAAANTQGLPGVFERLSNTADRAKLMVSDLARGPLMALGDAINDGLNNAFDRFETGVGAFGALKTFAAEAWPIIQKVGEALLDAAGAVASGAWQVFATTLTNAAKVAEVTLLPVLRFLADSGIANVIKTAGIAWGAWAIAEKILGNIHTGVGHIKSGISTALQPIRNFRTEMQQMSVAAQFVENRNISKWTQAFRVMENHVPVVHSMAEGYRGAASTATRFSGAMGVLHGAMAGVRHVGSNILNMLGGPWGAAFTAATIGITLWTSSVQQANNRAKLLEETLRSTQSASREVFEELARSGGDVNETVVGKVDEQVRALSRSFEELRRGAGAGDWLREFLNPWNEVNAFEIQDVAEAHERMSDVMKELKLDWDQVSAAVSGSSGDWAALESQLRGAGQAGEDLLNEIRPLREDFIKSQKAADNLTPGMLNLKEAMATYADETKSAADRTNALKRALDLMAGNAPDAAEAASRYQETMQRISESTAETVEGTQQLADAIESGVDPMEAMKSEGGRDLLAQLNDITDATVEMAAAGANMDDVFKQNRVTFELLADQYGLDMEKLLYFADKLAGYSEERITMTIGVEDEASAEFTSILLKLDELPATETITVTTLSKEAEDRLEEVKAKVDRVEENGKPVVKVTLDGDVKVKDQIRDLIREMTTIPGSLTITSSITRRSQQMRESIRGGDYLPIGPRAATPGGNERSTWPARAEGGSIFGPGTATSDSIPLLASNGEHMWSAAEVRGAGGHSNVEGLRWLARTGSLSRFLPGFDEGGDVSRRRKKKSEAPGMSWYRDELDAHAASLGMDTSGMDNKQQVLDAIAGSGAAGGSGTDIESALWYAYDQDGRNYEYGGTGQGGSSFDCSGYLSATWGVMTGRGPGRYFSTDSDFAALGFLPGYKAGAFNIGTNGGSGKNGHMAGTLPDGSHVESGANGVVYDGTVGALDPQFTEHWYYPVSADDPAIQQLAQQGWGRNSGGFGFGGGGGAGASAAAYGSPGGTDMARTEGWIPAGAGSTGVAGTSFAAGLLNMGAEAINGVIDQAASAASSAAAMGANVFAPGSGGAAGSAANFAIGIGTSAAKRGVSYGFQMASIGMDALVEQLTPLGAPRWLGYDYTSVMPQPGGMPSPTTSTEDAMLAQEQRAETRAPQGVTPDQWEARLNEHWAPLMGGAGAQGHGGAQGAQPGPPPGSDPWNTATQSAPATPAGGAATGQQDWLRRIGVFDEGGMLPPGGMGINLTNQPEPVLTSGQWDVLSRASEGLGTSGVGRNDYSIKIENIQVQDVAALQRELDSRQRLQMMRYAGRP